MDKAKAIANNFNDKAITNKILDNIKTSDKALLTKDNYNNKIDPKVFTLVNDKKSLSNKAIYEVENIRGKKELNKHKSSSTREWGNSVYLYNKNYIKNLPLATSKLDNILTSYFNLNYFNKGKKSKSTHILERKHTLNKTLISKSEVKVTSDKVNLTVYIYNRNKETLLKKLSSNKAKFSLANKKNLNKIIKHYSNFITKVRSRTQKLTKLLYIYINKKENLKLSNIKILDSKLDRKIIMKFFVKYLNRIYLKKMLSLYYTRHLVINNIKFKN